MEKEMKQKDNNYWRSFRELHNDPEFLAAKVNEFPEGAAEAPDIENMSSMSRRRFLALMGASAALAGTSCTPYRDKGKIMPYVKGRDGMLPGIPNYYASSWSYNGQSYGILVKTREGRPIKIDGNPDHPFNKGKIPPQLQAAIMDLYDPTRFKKPMRQTKSDLALYKNTYEEKGWKEVDKDIIGKLSGAAAVGKEIAVVTHTVTSPTGNKALEDFTAKYPTAKIYTYEQFNTLNRDRAWKKCYGTRQRPVIHFDRPDVILAIDADFLGTDPNSMAYIREYTSRREAVKDVNFNRLYMVEAGYSQTGINADYRFRLNPAGYYDFLMAIAAELSTSASLNENLRSRLSGYSLKKIAGKYNLDERKLLLLVADLKEKGDKALVYAGDEQPEEIHIIVNFINDLLGAKDTFDFDRYHVLLRDSVYVDEFAGLSRKMKEGKVAVVIHVDTNPVYDLPRDLDYAGALEKVETVISIASLENETANLSNYILPLHNPLEAWGDAHTFNGIYSLQQPVIQPLYDTRQAEAMLLVWKAGDPEIYSEDLYHDYLKDYWKNVVYPQTEKYVDFGQFWVTSLHDGVTYTGSVPAEKKAFNYNALIAVTPPKVKKGYTLVFKPSYTVGDGRYAHNGWLQELPHPVSKVTWDNYVAISPAAAEEFGIENNDMVKVTLDGHSVEIVAFVQPGLEEKTLIVEMGYGRKLAGPIGSKVGFDVNPLRPAKSGISNFVYSGASLEKTGGFYELASTQEHHVIDLEHIAEIVEQRELVHEGTLEEYRKNPNMIQEKRHKIFSITDDWEYNGLKWAMAIDLNKCIGCSICTISCNVENNIPVVGKDQVAVGREMTWMRIDRYYLGTPEEPKAVVQPMLCQQCDNAPCENVCPVAATVHSPDGLNDMSYNRCVGTRYCANNCPYKVRRFNYFDFRDRVADGFYYADSVEFLYNPEVTVRSRGVMEKCTFCVQRIQEEKDTARKEQREVDGSRVITACQEACPADAIVFGDVNRENSEIRQYHDHKLGYYVLEETNVRPNVTYITKLRNTHTEETA